MRKNCLPYSQDNKSKCASLSGFTLVELLIVITVIAALATVTYNIVNVTYLKQKSYDKNRIEAMRNLQTALNLYQGMLREFPGTDDSTVYNFTSGAPVSNDLLKHPALANTRFIQTYPEYLNPVTTGPSCNFDSNPYQNRFNYVRQNGGESYILFTNLVATEAPSPCPSSVTASDSSKKCYCIVGP